MKKTINISIIKQISTASLQKILDESTSLSNAINKIGVDGLKTYYIDILRDRIKNESLSIDNMNKNHIVSQRKNSGMIPNDEVFIKNSPHARGVIRNKILKCNLIEYKCSECTIIDQHNGKKLSLQLDHINGVQRISRNQ